MLSNYSVASTFLVLSLLLHSYWVGGFRLARGLQMFSRLFIFGYSFDFHSLLLQLLNFSCLIYCHSSLPTLCRLSCRNLFCWSSVVSVLLFAVIIAFHVGEDLWVTLRSYFEPFALSRFANSSFWLAFLLWHGLELGLKTVCDRFCILSKDVFRSSSDLLPSFIDVCFYPFS